MLRNRIILAALWILSLVGISFFGGPVSYGFFAVITFIPIFSLIYLLLVLARFKIYQHFECHELVADHLVPFYFTLQNEDYFAFTSVKVGFYEDFSRIEGLSGNIEYELLPQTGIKKETSLLCRYRGEYFVGIRSVTIRDYFNIFKLTYKNREALRVTVLPDIKHIDAIKSADMDTLCNRQTPLAETIPDVTVRDYVRGDDVRRINWKQSARLNTLMIRNYEGEEKNGVTIVIDSRRADSDINVYLPVENKVLETAIALTLYLCGKNIPVNVMYYRKDAENLRVENAEDFNAFYRAVSALSFDTETDAGQVYDSFRSFEVSADHKFSFIITGDESDAPGDYALDLNNGGTEAVIYRITDKEPESRTYALYPHTTLVTIPVDADLTKVL